MFKAILDTNFYDTVLEIAKKTVISKDRECYRELFDLCIGMIRDDGKIIVSDPMTLMSINISRKLIVNKNELPRENLTIYTTHTRRTTTKLTNSIHKMIGKLVQMREVIPNEEYEILYNMRSVIRVYRIDRYKNVSLENLFRPINNKGLNLFPPEIELMDIYHKLYLPNYYAEWDNLLQYEPELWKSVNLRKSTIIGGAIIGGAKIDGAKPYTKNIVNKCNPCRDKRNSDIGNLKLLFLKFLHNEKYVIIGNWAHNLLHQSKKEKTDIFSREKIQIISENDIDHDYNNIVSYLASFTNYGIFYKKKQMYIPKDNRLFKYTLYIKYPEIKSGSMVEKPFLDIYNCGSYELIPYIPVVFNEMTLNVGNLSVQMRFLLMDLWILRLLLHLKVVNKEQMKSKGVEIFEQMNELKKILKFTPDDKYVGINFDEKVFQKIEISEKQIKRSTYYPELSIKKNNKYELIATS
jgi:hypothetical protein